MHETRVPSNTYRHPVSLSSEAAQRRPTLVAFLCVLISVLPSYFVPPGPLKSNGSPARIVELILFVTVVLGFLLTRSPRRAMTIQPGVFVVGFYAAITFLVCGVSASQPINQTADAAITRTLILVLTNAGLALYVMRQVGTFRQRNVILGSLAIGLTLNCMVGILQNFFNIDLHAVLQPPGFVTNVNAEGLSQAPEIVERFGARRAFGNSAHPIEYSVLASIAVLLNLYYTRNAATRNRRHLAATGAGIALLAVPAGVSRSGVVALVVAMAFYMWSLNLRRIAIGLAVGTMALLPAVAFSTNLEALWLSIIGAPEDDSIAGRLNDLAAVSQVFRSHPILGIGIGQNVPGSDGIYDNQWLTAFVTGGVINVAGLAVLAGGGIFGIAAALRNVTTSSDRDQTYMVGAIFLAVLGSSFTFDFFSFPQVTFVFFLTLSLLWSKAKKIDVPATEKTSRHDR